MKGFTPMTKPPLLGVERTGNELYLVVLVYSFGIAIRKS
jgi:hypothetical protein